MDGLIKRRSVDLPNDAAERESNIRAASLAERGAARERAFQGESAQRAINVPDAADWRQNKLVDERRCSAFQRARVRERAIRVGVLFIIATSQVHARCRGQEGCDKSESIDLARGTCAESGIATSGNAVSALPDALTSP